MGLVLGLTGSFGSGKSAVSAMFRDRGVPVIDADRMAREAVEPGKPALARIVEAFGADLLAPDGTLRRKALAERVFGNRAALERLNRIVHPPVIEAQRRLLRELGGKPLVILEAPLLYEAGVQTLADKVLVVIVNERQRFARLKSRGYTEQEIIARLGMQMPQGRKIKLADYVIDNSGNMDATRAQVDTLLAQIEGVKREEQ